MNRLKKVLRNLRLPIGCGLLVVALSSSCTYDTAPLHTAIRKSNTQRALQHIAKGKDINKRDSVMHEETVGKTPLYCATERGQYDVVAALLKSGADVRMEEEKEGKLPIHAAAMNGHAQIAKLLITHGAKVNARDDYGRLPLVFAAESGHADTVGVLLDEGAQVNAQNTTGLSAILAASWHGHFDVVQRLIRRGADVNAGGEGGWTPVILAASCPAAKVADCLVRNGANVNATTEDGWTALMMAATKGDLSCVRLLVENGAALDARSQDTTWTALHFAGYEDHMAVGDYLIKCGIRPKAVSNTERDCYATAVSYKLLARYHEEQGSTEAAIPYYKMSGEYYAKASSGFKERSREIRKKISSAQLAALGRFAGALALSAALSTAMPSINTGSTSHHVVFHPTGGPSAETTDLSDLKKDCDRRVKESDRCAAACRQIIDCYQGNDSARKREKRIREAKETLGLL